MRIIYSFFIFCYSLSIRIAALANSKAKRWVDGRENIFELLGAAFKNTSPHAKIIWMHCASLGEFEQGRPLLEKLKSQSPNTKFLLTFFSPSGYEIRKNYAGADWVFYLPIDSKKNAQRFIDIVKPTTAIFVKYEFWFNYLDALYQKKIPCYFISVNIRGDHYFLKWYGSWALKQLRKVTHFFVQNQSSVNLLTNVGITNCTLAGDTRFDRVIEISKQAKIYPEIARFCANKKVLVAGSTWPEDEKLIAQWMQQTDSKNKNHVVLIAPHEINEQSLIATESIFKDLKCLRYSKLKTSQNEGESYDVLIIDNIGMLSSLYNYSNICYIGGGFGRGIHNILEAAVFGKPILFGPHFQKFEEAIALIKRGGATSISTSEELNSHLAELQNNEKKYREQCLISQEFVRDNAGAAERIVTALL